MSSNINNFALIVGSMKSGTTSLFSYLEQHPEIAPCQPKEPHFFSTQTRFERGLEYYRSLWSWQPEQHKIALEASTSYTGLKRIESIPGKLNSAAAIASYQQQYNLQFKFIYLMRHPVERLESHYNHLKRSTYSDREIDSRKLSLMLESSKYAMQMDEYYQRFPQENILLLNFDELKQDPARLVEKVCQFLEVDPNYSFTGLNVTHNAHAQKQKITIPGWSTLKQSSAVKALLNKAPTSAKDSLRSLLGRKVAQSYTKFSAAEKQYFQQQLERDLQRLSGDYQFDLSSWKLDL